MPYERKKILIVVKTYPQPSTSLRETVCTAGITDDGKWIRLYPIPYRDLEQSNRYRIFQWIEIDVEKSSKDYRPESYKVDSDSLIVRNFLDPQKDIKERVTALSKIAISSYAEAVRLRDEENVSLAAFIPKEVTGMTFKRVAREWTDEELTKLNQTSLFDTDDQSKNPRRILKKIPYEFRIKFTCTEPNCPGHDLRSRNGKLCRHTVIM